MPVGSKPAEVVVPAGVAGIEALVGCSCILEKAETAETRNWKIVGFPSVEHELQGVIE